MCSRRPSGTVLTDPDPDRDNMYKRDWAPLGFVTAWVQLSESVNVVDQGGSGGFFWGGFLAFSCRVPAIVASGLQTFPDNQF